MHHRIFSGVALSLLCAAFIIMCLPTWSARWLAGDGETFTYTYHRWFATAIGFFDVVAPVTMLLATALVAAVMVDLWLQRIGWFTVALGGVSTAFLTAFGYSEQWPGRTSGSGVWVAPLLGLATLLLLTGKLSPRTRRPHYSGGNFFDLDGGTPRRK